MAIKKCKGCGAIFESYGHPFCQKCMALMDEKYKDVRDYLYENPYETVEQVSEKTDTPEWMIIYFLRDGRLDMANASGFLRCEQCGKAITSGRYCPACTQKLGSKIQSVLPKAPPPAKYDPFEKTSKGQMHTRR